MSKTVCGILNLLRSSKIFVECVRTVQTTHFARKILGFTSLGIAIAKCDQAEKECAKQNLLSREECIKQACLLSVNSATTLLTTTSSAVLDICKEYKDSLSKILFLLEQVKSIEGGENQDLWDAIVEARANVNRAKMSLNEINSYMNSVEKVVNSTTEAAFLAGADFMCNTLCERLYSAQREISSQITELKKLEEEYVVLQGEIASSHEKSGIKKSKKPDIGKPKEKKNNNNSVLQH